MIVLNFYNSSTDSDDFIRSILRNENKQIPDDFIQSLKNKYNHDLRSIINSIQSYDCKSSCQKNSLSLLDKPKFTIKHIRSELARHDKKDVLSKIYMYLLNHYVIESSDFMKMKSLYIDSWDDGVEYPLFDIFSHLDVKDIKY